MQSLTQAALQSMQEFDANDKAATIPRLDQVKLVAERTGISPGDINTIRKRRD